MVIKHQAIKGILKG